MKSTKKFIFELERIVRGIEAECAQKLAQIDSTAQRCVAISAPSLADKLSRVRELLTSEALQARKVLDEASKLVALIDEVVSEINKQKGAL